MNSQYVDPLTKDSAQANNQFEVLAASVKRRPKPRNTIPVLSSSSTSVVADFSTDNPITGKGIFAHNAQNPLPYRLLLSRLYLQKDYYPSLSTYKTEEARNLSLHVITERKITTIGNWKEFCNSIRREKPHVLQYLLTELGTNEKRFVGESGALVIKGRFRQKQIHNVVRCYEKIYVLCKKCDSRNTTLGTTNRAQQPHFLVCHACAEEYEIPRIRTGFVNRIPRVRRKAPDPPEEDREDEPETETEVFHGPGQKCFEGFHVKSRL